MSQFEHIDGENTTLIYQGAEARLYSTILNGTECFVKERFQKSYRIPALDSRLRKKQMKSEIRSLKLASEKGIPVPQVIKYDNDRCILYLSKLTGISVRQYISDLGDLSDPLNHDKVTYLAQSIGNILHSIHSNRIVHGDLTTSNMMVVPKNMIALSNDDNNNTNTQNSITIESCGTDYTLYLVDFGLSSVSDLVEDLAVDLYVLERAIQTTHPNSEYLINTIFSSYSDAYGTTTTKRIIEAQQTQQQQQHIDNNTDITAVVAPLSSSDDTIQSQQHGSTTAVTSEDITTTQSSSLTQAELSKIRKNAKALAKQEAKMRKFGTQSERGTVILSRLDEVRARGRKKSMIG